MKNSIIYLVWASLLISSCQEIFYNEDEITREVHLGDFHAVIIRGIYNVILVQDSSNCLVITGENNINSIDAKVENDTLIIDDHKKISLNVNKNTLTLHFSNLKFMLTYDPVNLSNTGTIKADQFTCYAMGEISEGKLVFDCNNLIVENSSNTLGYLHLYGKSNYCYFYNYYGSCMFADSLLCKDAEVFNSSVGDIHVNASEHIKVYIRGNGNICYYGTPVIEIAEKRGKGNIIRLN